MALRRLPRTPSWPRAAALGAALAVSVTVLTGLLAALSGGPVAAGRLETVGPSALPVGAFAALEIGLPALLAVLGVVAYRRLWLTRQPRTASEPADAAEASPPGRLRRWRTSAVSSFGGLLEPLRGRRGDDDDDDAVWDTDDTTLDDIDTLETETETDTDTDAHEPEQPTVVIDLTDPVIDLVSDPEPDPELEPEAVSEPQPQPEQQPQPTADAPVDLVKHEPPSGELGAGWDAELTQELDLTGLEAAVASRSAGKRGRFKLPGRRSR